VDKVEVRVFPQGRGYRLELYHEGVHIGEYERSRAKEESGDLAAKVKEAEGASDLLLDACKRTANGKIAVRCTEDRQKEIRTYQDGQPDPGHGETRVIYRSDRLTTLRAPLGASCRKGLVEGGRASGSFVKPQYILYLSASMALISLPTPSEMFQSASKPLQTSL